MNSTDPSNSSNGVELEATEARTAKTGLLGFRGLTGDAGFFRRFSSNRETDSRVVDDDETAKGRGQDDDENRQEQEESSSRDSSSDSISAIGNGGDDVDNVEEEEEEMEQMMAELESMLKPSSSLAKEADDSTKHNTVIFQTTVRGLAVDDEHRHERDEQDFDKVAELQNTVSALMECLEEKNIQLKAYMDLETHPDTTVQLQNRLLLVESENKSLRDQLADVRIQLKAKEQELVTLRLEELEGMSGWGFRDAASFSSFLRVDAEEWRRIHAERDTAIVRAGELAYQLADAKADADELSDKLMLAEHLLQVKAAELERLNTRNSVRSFLSASAATENDDEACAGGSGSSLRDSVRSLLSSATAGSARSINEGEYGDPNKDDGSCGNSLSSVDAKSEFDNHDGLSADDVAVLATV